MKRAWLALLLLLIALGLFAGAQQWHDGDVATGLGTIGAGGVVWGLYVVGDGFFASLALAGLAVACVIRVLRLRGMEQVAQQGLSLAVAGLLVSILCVLADLGRPIAAMVNLPLYGRTSAPFFWTFTLVAGALLFASLVHLLLASRPAWALQAQVANRAAMVWRILACGWQGTASARRRRKSVDFWLSLALLPLLLVGLFVLGVVFSARAGRPAWLVWYEVLTFIVSAAAAGCSLLVMAAFTQRRLARVLAVLIAFTVVLVVYGQILALRAPSPSVQGYTRALLVGPWSGLFWTELVLWFAAAIICLAKLWRGRSWAGWAAATACLVCAAVFIQRTLVLVAWQAHGLGLPWPAGAYHPTWVEWGVLLGIAAVGALVFWLLAKVCPAASRTLVGASPPDEKRRLVVTATCLFLGLALACAGLALSAGLASRPFLDPIVPGSPLIFLGGLLFMLSSALVYELYPERPQRGQ